MQVSRIFDVVGHGVSTKKQSMTVYDMYNTLSTQRALYTALVKAHQNKKDDNNTMINNSFVISLC